ncbi:MAG: ATP-binding protein [Crocinitomicaceae bacterium]|nr:PAS domain S-box protein [Crocinitomicaceae bacterium]
MAAPQIKDIYKILFESIGEGLLIADRTGTIVMANPRCCELFGCTEEGMEGRKVEELIPMNLREKHVHHREYYQANPKKRQMGMNMNLLAQRKDGSKFHVEISLNHFKSGEDIYIVAVLTDVSERVRQQTEIKELNANLEKKVELRTREVLESQKLYSAIAKNFPNGTINVFDKDLKYIFVEGLELQELGINKELLIGTSYLDKIQQEVRPKLEKELVEVFKGKAKKFEINYMNQIYRINAVPLSVSDNVIDKILVVEENVTAQKQVEKKREEALSKEKQLNEMKSRFVSMASHEFRTPLSTVLSSVSLIEKYIEKGDLDKTEKHTSRIKSAVAGLTEILNDFLSVDKLESNKSVVEKKDFDYKEFALEITEEMKTICKPGQEIVVNMTGENWMIHSDPRIMKNVLYNLISNAIKYSPEGQKIAFNSAIQDKSLKVEVIDKGIGIPAEDQKELFSRFFRAKNVTNIKGTGLGLNIVKKYVEMLGGDISFTSELNEGSTFFVNLPINHSHNA